MKRKDDIWKNELWSQQEVANHFRVTSNTIKNWRDKGLLSYCQAPGSSRKLYFKDEVLSFIKTHSVIKEDSFTKDRNKVPKEKPVKSNNLHNEDWRI